MTGKIVSLNISERKGVRKKPVKKVSLKAEYGIEGECPGVLRMENAESICLS